MDDAGLANADVGESFNPPDEEEDEVGCIKVSPR
jgi:hypothetical protein